jgi:hypothetical protein
MTATPTDRAMTAKAAGSRERREVTGVGVRRVRSACTVPSPASQPAAVRRRPSSVTSGRNGAGRRRRFHGALAEEFRADQAQHWAGPRAGRICRARPPSRSRLAAPKPRRPRLAAGKRWRHGLAAGKRWRHGLAAGKRWPPGPAACKLRRHGLAVGKPRRHGLAAGGPWTGGLAAREPRTGWWTRPCPYTRSPAVDPHDCGGRGGAGGRLRRTARHRRAERPGLPRSPRHPGDGHPDAPPPGGGSHHPFTTVDQRCVGRVGAHA